jgi:hypothetical protein
MTTPTDFRAIAVELATALRELQSWCGNNVAYYPDIRETDQNSGESHQTPEDLSQYIDRAASDALAKYDAAVNP